MIRDYGDPKKYAEKLEKLMAVAKDLNHLAIGIRYSLPNKPDLQEVWCKDCKKWSDIKFSLYSYLLCTHCNETIAWLDYNGYPIIFHKSMGEHPWDQHVYEVIPCRFKNPSLSTPLDNKVRID